MVRKKQIIFISHSSKDKPFVRKLDATLSGFGIHVFLDERDIKVGDSIPAKIYDGISKATHFIYVISSNSKNSAWVQEELDVAKMKQKENAGCVILPVLIEQTELPTAVKHVRYADFLNWQDSKSFLTGMNTILQSLGVQILVPEKMELSFYLANIEFYSRLERTITEFGGYVDGACDTEYALEREESKIKNGVRIAMKWRLESGDLHNLLKDFLSMIKEKNIPEHTRLFELASLANDFIHLLENDNWHDGFSYPREIRNLTWRFGDMLANLRIELISMVSGNYKV